MKKLVVFDVDGVLIDTKIGSFKEIGILVGKEKEVLAHAEEYARRKHLGPWGLDELAMIFNGIEEKKIINAAEKVIEKQLMPGTKETMFELKKEGFLIASYSSSPSWIMETLSKKFGFDDVCNNLVEVKSGIITGKLIKKVNRYVKAESLRKFLKNKNISKKNIFIIGDSISDLPIAEYGRFKNSRRSGVKSSLILERLYFFIKWNLTYKSPTILILNKDWEIFHWLRNEKEFMKKFKCNIIFTDFNKDWAKNVTQEINRLTDLSLTNKTTRLTSE